jgi:hypothetical protein
MPEEVCEVVRSLEVEHSDPRRTTPEDVSVATEAVTRSPALGTDVERVGKRLRSQGWELKPVAGR